MGKTTKKKEWISFFNVDYCLSELYDMRAIDRVDLVLWCNGLALPALRRAVGGR